jgi:signal recognition particle 43 kDa protein
MACSQPALLPTSTKTSLIPCINLRQLCVAGPSGRGFKHSTALPRPFGTGKPALHVGPAQPQRAISLVAAATGEIVDVESLKGIRALVDQEDRPLVEYLVAWKDGSPDTWEPAANLADDLLRDYEQRWWGAVRKGDEDTIKTMLQGGSAVLSRTVDDARRSALHFAAGLGRPNLVQMLLAAGAEVDLADREGYTPLHMAAGYLHTSTIVALLDGGADPEQQDRQGRSPLELVESLRAALPAGNPATVARRVALEDVLKVLTDNLFEDVEPAAVLEARMPEKEAGQGDDASEMAASLPKEREFLVQFPDEAEPVWVPEKYMSQEVMEDFDAGLEYAEAQSVVGVRNRGDSRTYLVRWGDGYPDSWEPEEHVSADLVRLFEESQGKKNEDGDYATLLHSQGQAVGAL